MGTRHPGRARSATALGLMISLLAAAPAAAQVTLVGSTFDAGAEGWRSGDFYGTGAGNPSTWVAAGGNPGGFIRTTDVSNIAGFIAPAAYLGNRSAALGGSFRLDMRVDLAPNTNIAQLRLSNGTLDLYFYGADPAVDSWSTLVVPLTASSAWRVGTATSSPTPGTGTVATQAQLLAVLSNLTQLRVLADQHNGTDRTDLDNVALLTAAPSSVPEPGTVMLVATGLLAVGGAAARRRR